MDGQDWRAEHLLSLAGVYQPAKEIGRSKVPAALTRFLKEYPEVAEVELHLDNDRAGKLAAEAIMAVFPKQYRIRDKPPPKGKDCNDFLCIRLGIRITVRLTRLAFNLWNGYVEQGEERMPMPYFYEAIKMRYPEYCRNLPAVKTRADNAERGGK